MGVLHYRELIVWQKAMDLVAAIYELTATMPTEERYGLKAQLQRAAVSVPSNIAEGHARRSTREYMRFISFALGSLAELETQVLLAERLSYASIEGARSLLDRTSEIGKMLRSIERKLTHQLSQAL